MNKTDKSNRPLVCVQCMTFNHENYIEDALNGFAMQQTNFPFVVAVVDDASTDNNAVVIAKWVSKNCDCKSNNTDEEKDYGRVIQAHPLTNPNCLFHIVLLKENHYKKKPKRPYYAEYYDAAKYIACCEGDDYWIDPHKLQKQVDFLESHSEYMLVFHNAIMHFEDSSEPDCSMRFFKTGTFSTAQLVELWQLPYASYMYRSNLESSDKYLNLTKVCPGSYARLLAASLLGKVYGIAECMSVYRKNQGGVSNTMTHAWALQTDYNLAIATGDVDAINAMHRCSEERLKWAMPNILKGKPEFKELWQMALSYNKWLPYKVLILYVLKWPKRKIRAFKHKLLRK